MVDLYVVPSVDTFSIRHIQFDVMLTLYLLGSSDGQRVVWVPG